MRKTRNYKRKNRRHTQKYKNIKQHKKGGSPEDENDLIIVGEYIMHKYPGLVNPLFANINYNNNYSLYPYRKFEPYGDGFNNIRSNNIMPAIVGVDLNKADKFNNLLDIIFDYSSKYELGYYYNDIKLHSSVEQYLFKINLDRLNLLKKLKNVNIYRLIDRGILFCDEEDNIMPFSTQKHLGTNIFEMLADYVDLKYNNILINPNHHIYGNKINIIKHDSDNNIKSYKVTNTYDINNPVLELTINLKIGDLKTNLRKIKQGILAVLGTQPYSYLPSKKRYLRGNRNIIDDVTINDFRIFENVVSYKDAIEALERSYPTLIARVLLETDAELAGEEPHEVRQSRASRIMEEGMERLKKNTSVPDEIDNVPFIEDEEV